MAITKIESTTITPKSGGLLYRLYTKMSNGLNGLFGRNPKVESVQQQTRSAVMSSCSSDVDTEARIKWNGATYRQIEALLKLDNLTNKQKDSVVAIVVENLQNHGKLYDPDSPITPGMFTRLLLGNDMGDELKREIDVHEPNPKNNRGTVENLECLFIGSKMMLDTDMSQRYAEATKALLSAGVARPGGPTTQSKSEVGNTPRALSIA